MHEEMIALAIRQTTGSGDTKPFVYRVLMWLTNQCEWLERPSFSDVVDYFHMNHIDAIPVKDYPKTQMH